MDVTPILESLNDAQRQAVTAPQEPLLVIAGAGSGKTRVLTHRAAWLIDVEGCLAQGLLAVTFTNKAAAEMRGRIESLLDMPVQPPVDRHLPRPRPSPAAPPLEGSRLPQNFPDHRFRRSVTTDQAHAEEPRARREPLGAAREFSTSSTPERRGPAGAASR